MSEPELDYAFLAEFAKVEANKLTAIGASYTFVHTPNLPAFHMLSVAGRVRVNADTDPVQVAFSVVPPGKEYELDLGIELSPGSEARPYNGKLGLVFAVSLQMPLPGEGLYEVVITIDGKPARRLAFEVALSSPSA